MEISENGKKAIDSFIKWINECKKNNIYNLHYTMFPDNKDEHQPYAVCITKETCDSNAKFDILLGRFFLNMMVMNFVLPDEMKSLLALAHSKGYWSNKKYDGDWPRIKKD